jgi:hypothetical protein
MTIGLTVKHANARQAGSRADLDTGVGNAAVRIYGGVRPASPADVPTSVMLVQIGLTKPCGTVADGLLTLTQLADGLIAETGVPTWARFVDGDGATCFDCDAGAGSGAWEVQLPATQTTLYAGGDARIVSAVLG